MITVHGETKKDSISALREQTTLANTRLDGVFLRFAIRASLTTRAVEQRSILIAASIIALGCASSSPAPDTGVEPERAPAPIVRDTPQPATTTPVRAGFTYAPGTVSYIVTSEATIAEIDSTASVPRAFQEVGRVELAITSAGNHTIVTTTGIVEGSTGASTIQPFVDTLRAESMDAAAEPRMPICGRDTVPPVHLVTLLPPMPQELREGVRWQRRHVYASCQGTIPVRVERTDSYLVAGSAPQVARAGVTITRSSSLAYAGAGVEGQHNVRITGAGSGQATLIFDTSAGRLMSATEEINAEIGITASGGTRRFSQRVTRTVEERR